MFSSWLHVYFKGPQMETCKDFTLPLQRKKKSLYCIKIYSGNCFKISEISLMLVSPVISFILGKLTMRHDTSPHLRVRFNISK